MSHLEQLSLNQKKTNYEIEIINDAQKYVQKLFVERADSRLILHNYALTLEVMDKIHAYINSEEGLDPISTELVLMAGWFSFAGVMDDYSNLANQSILNAKRFMKKMDYSPAYTGQVILCLKAAHQLREPDNFEEKCVADALKAVLYGDKFMNYKALHRLELELMLDQEYNDLDWESYQLQRLFQIKFYTHLAKKFWEPIVAQNILIQKTKIEKLQRKLLKSGGLENQGTFKNLGDQVTERTIQTYFKSNYRNHINLSAIADNKANIMISVNAILISVLISVLSYRNLTETNPAILMPVVLFLVSGLTSLIFAVLSARPKVTSVLSDQSSKNEIKKNLVFFGNFARLPVEQYEEAMEDMFREEGQLLSNMTRDMYYLGKVLDKKYRFLTISYNVFMIGFIVTVLLFIGIALM